MEQQSDLQGLLLSLLEAERRRGGLWPRTGWGRASVNDRQGLEFMSTWRPRGLRMRAQAGSDSQGQEKVLSSKSDLRERERCGVLNPV